MNCDRSPEITFLTWDHIEVAHRGIFEDIEAYLGGVRAWDWNETGTNNILDVIVFPKTTSALLLMDGSPATVSKVETG